MLHPGPLACPAHKPENLQQGRFCLLSMKSTFLGACKAIAHSLERRVAVMYAKTSGWILFHACHRIPPQSN
eukprot:1158303-Pelagomonas_calceolata.AAC.9